MVQLRTQRTALALYSVLLVLPTLVLGFLQWHDIVLKRDAENAASRFREVLQDRLDKLIDAEQVRPFWQYAFWYLPESSPTTLLASPLPDEQRPQGLLAWFVFDMNEKRQAEVDMFFGAEPNVADKRGGEFKNAARDLVQRFVDDGILRRAARAGPELEPSKPALAQLAGSRATQEDQDCLGALRMLLTETHVSMETSPFHLQFYQEPDGTPRIVATRRVLAQQLPQLVGLSECVHRLAGGLGLVQGFFIDPDWFFGDLPEQVARAVLNDREHFLGIGRTCCDGTQEYRSEIRLVSDLALETYRREEKDYGLMRIVIDTAEVEQRFHATAWRFFGVALMLALSLSTGMFLVWRSIARDLAQAQRTENFVAAVTHELRTPLASIKMHGEMLLDGWAKEPAKQTEYYRRIVRETGRLSTLVERVLEKARLASGSIKPAPGDLSGTVAALQEELMRWGDSARPDVEFELAADLPLVMLTPEGVRSVVDNLVENARKYAPVDFNAPQPQPILVVTRREGAGAVLEVLDRGPGVAAAERERIFDAFYRVGNESTRTSRGTGLGLHLVALHAAALGGKAQVRARDGGGAIFSVSFPAAPNEPS